MRLTLTTVRRDGNLKREYTFINPRDGFAFVLDRYIELRREGNKGRFKMCGKWERTDKRQNTCEPPHHDWLKPQLLEAIGEKLEIIE